MSRNRLGFACVVVAVAMAAIPIAGLGLLSWCSVQAPQAVEVPMGVSAAPADPPAVEQVEVRQEEDGAAVVRKRAAAGAR